MNDGFSDLLKSLRNLLAALIALVGLSVVAVPGEWFSGEGNVGPGLGLGPARELTEEELADQEAMIEAGRSTQRRAEASSRDANRTLECAAGKNGGKTDRGVSGNRINLAATNVRSGQGESFLGTAWIGMQALVNKINAEGGICGRQLSLRLVDDGWDGPRGAGFLKNFTEQEYFALPVVPSSEGLTVAIINKTIQDAGIPVVGSDGMLKEQYFDPWVWPVAAATVTQMRVMAKHAISQGATTCGIVYDNKYRFGLEGAEAFRAYANKSGCTVRAFVGIPPGEGSYGGYINRFNTDCDPSCEFVAMLLEPGTASTWIAGQPSVQGRKRGFGSKLTGGAQPLFNERFGRDCGAPCDEMLVWTGYNPPIGGNAGKAGVVRYVNDVRSIVPDVDVTNQFLQGSYLGMSVFVQAIKETGPGLTRAGLKATLDKMTYVSDLAPPLTWAPTSKFANCGAQAFRIVLAGGSFGGFAESGTGFIPDPECGKV